MSKSDVNGPGANDVYSWLRKNSKLYDPELKKAKKINWNYSKFLIDSNGEVVKHYEQIPPIEFKYEIDELLGI